MTGLRGMSTGTLLLVGAIAVVFGLSATNVSKRLHESHGRKNDIKAFHAWTAAHGGRELYGPPSTDVHSRHDVICAPHYPKPLEGPVADYLTGADYRIYLLVDSYHSGRVLRAVRGPVKPKPTPTGPRCGAPPRYP